MTLTDTRDNGNHANYWGSAKASDYLAGYLEERGLPDHRGQNGYEDWDRILENYQEWEQEQLLTDQEAAYAYLNTLANIKKDVLTIVTVKDEASQAWNETLETAIHNLGISSSFYHQIQNSFVAIIDGGISQFEKWDDHRIKVNSNYQINESELLKLSISSAGFVCGNLSSIMVDGTGYSLNTRGLNIVVIDKQTGQVISSASIDTHTSDLTFREKKLSEAQSAVWERVTYAADRLVEDGVYNIIPSGNPECAVDIPYGDTAENVNVWLCSRNGLSPQEFELHLGHSSQLDECIDDIKKKSEILHTFFTTRGCTYRKAAKTDLPEIWMLWEDKLGKHTYTLNSIPDAELDEMERHGRCDVICDSEGNIIAASMYLRKKAVAHGLHTATYYEGSGLGAAVLYRSMARAYQEGCKKFAVWVREDNLASTKLIRHIFAPTGKFFRQFVLCSDRK